MHKSLRFIVLYFLLGCCFQSSAFLNTAGFYASQNFQDPKEKLKRDSIKRAEKLAALKAKQALDKIAREEEIKKAQTVGKFIQHFKFRENRRIRNDSLMYNIAERLFNKDAEFLITLLDGENKRDSLFITDTIAYKGIMAGIKTLSVNITKIDSLQARLKLLEAEDAIDELVNKIYPILKKQLDKRVDAEENSAQSARLKNIRYILSHGNKKDTVRAGDSATVYTLGLKKRAELFGYHRTWTKDNFANYKFKLISTLAFFGYELNGKTGEAKNLHGWDTSLAVTAAQQANCKVVLVVTSKNAGDIKELLGAKGKKAQAKLLGNVAELLERRGANGINIMIEGLPATSRKSFVSFVALLSNGLRAKDPTYSISLTLPAFDKEEAYDVDALGPLVDKFILDFTKTEGTVPLAPLTGSDNSIKESINHYLNQNIPTEKIIACLPYHGLYCDEEGLKDPLYKSYAEIVNKYGVDEGIYDEQTASMCIDDILTEDGTTHKIWYDNAKTLSEKFDYILKSDINGIGIFSLGYDNGREELWNMLLDKMYALDTISIQVIHKPEPLTLLGKIKKELYWYKMMLSQPCKVDREDMKSDNAIGYITVAFAIILAVLSIFCMYKLKFEGDGWKWKTLMLRLLIALALIEFVCIFLYFFLKKDFPLFGLSNSKETCVPVPFALIIMVISIGFAFGLFVMKFLVTPLGKKDERP